MSVNVAKEVAAMKRMTVKQLKSKYAEVFGDETRTGNKAWLMKRIAWRLQAISEGGLSERARHRAHELANDADIRMSPPRVRVGSTEALERIMTAPIQFSEDQRLPLPGTVLFREYKGNPLQVRVLDRGFEFEGDVYRSLSAVAKKITGTHINGFNFFRLQKGAM